MLLFDNGNEKASPYDPPWGDQNNYSRAVEYSIDETNMTVTQVWDSTTTDTNHYFSQVMGDADLLPKTQNVLITYAYIIATGIARSERGLNLGRPRAYTGNSMALANTTEYTSLTRDS